MWRSRADPCTDALATLPSVILPHNSVREISVQGCGERGLRKAPLAISRQRMKR